MTRLSEHTPKLRFVTGAEVRYCDRFRSMASEAQNGFDGVVRLLGTKMRYEFSRHGLHDCAADPFIHGRHAENKRQRYKAKKGAW